MAFQNKLAPLRVTISADDFDKLITLIDGKDIKLIDKLVTYTFIKDGNKAELRLFPHEAECIFLLLFQNLKDISSNDDYYKQLVKIRKEYIEKNKKGGDTNA